jgi:hypothetical protein
MNYGFLRSKMIRIQMLHSFIWQLTFGKLSPDNTINTIDVTVVEILNKYFNFFYLSIKSIDQILILILIWNRMTVKMYLQIIGHSYYVPGLIDFRHDEQTTVENAPETIRYVKLID